MIEVEESVFSNIKWECLMKRIVSSEVVESQAKWYNPYSWIDALPEQWGGPPEQTPERMLAQKIEDIARNVNEAFRMGTDPGSIDRIIEVLLQAKQSLEDIKLDHHGV